MSNNILIKSVSNEEFGLFNSLLRQAGKLDDLPVMSIYMDITCVAIG